MSDLLLKLDLTTTLLPLLLLGAGILLRPTWREGFFGTYYFAFATASGRGPAQGSGKR